MLSNEKRAHDIAVAMLPRMLDARANEQANQLNPNDSEIAVDIYQEYKAVYEAALTPLNRDFPEGK